MSGYLFLSAAETTKPVSDFLKVWKAGAHLFTRRMTHLTFPRT